MNEVERHQRDRGPSSLFASAVGFRFSERREASRLKTRHETTYGGHVLEVDVFHGDNDGLVIAEVELTSVNESFDRPPWLGEEVSGQTRYYNVSLLKHPYIQW